MLEDTQPTENVDQSLVQAAIDQRVADWGEISELFQLISGHESAVVVFGAMSRYIRIESSLSARIRELAVLRTAFLLDLAYCVSRHLPIALAAGLTDEDVAALRNGEPPVLAERFSEVEQEVLAAVDALALGRRLAASRRDALDVVLTRPGTIDLCLTVGWYRLIGCVINGFEL